MKFLPIILLPITVSATIEEAPCPEGHEGVVDFLTGLYGGDNCVESSDDINCELNFLGYRTYSDYTVIPGSFPEPLGLVAISTYFDENGDFTSSLATWIDFQLGDCLKDPDMQSHYSAISSVIGNNLPPCPEDHDDIVDFLTGIYGEDNCAESDDSEEINCEVNFPGYRAKGDYSFLPQGGTNIPLSLTAISTNLDENGETTTSLATGIDFQLGDCLYDPELQSNFNSIDSQISSKFCTNAADPFIYKKKKTITCDEVGGKKLNKQGRLCLNNSAIADNCPIICKTISECGCVDNSVEFPLRGDKTFKCSELEDLSDKKRQKKCKNTIIGHHCPSYCSGACAR